MTSCMHGTCVNGCVWIDDVLLLFFLGADFELGNSEKNFFLLLKKSLYDMTRYSSSIILF